MEIKKEKSRLPPLDPLESVILQWDILDDQKSVLYEDGKQRSPEDISKISKSLGKGIHLKALPTNFESIENYINSFFPLFLLECKESIFKAILVDMEGPEKMESITLWTHQDFTMFKLKRVNSVNVSPLSNGDLVLLLADNKTDANHPSNVTKDDINGAMNKEEEKSYILGIVDIASNVDLTVKLKIPSVNPSDGTKYYRIKNIIANLTEMGSDWSVRRIMSLATIYREYQGLMSFPDLFIKDSLLCMECESDHQRVKRTKFTSNNIPYPEKSNLDTFRRIEEATNATLEIPYQLKQLLSELYNDSQLNALNNCMKTSGITLIQGPPGTGKTTTIIGILSVLLNAMTKTRPPKLNSPLKTFKAENNLYNHPDNKLLPHLEKTQPWLFNSSNYIPWYDEMEYSIEDLEYQSSLKDLTKASNDHLVVNDRNDAIKPQRVLLCAPSNAAIDEILKRLTIPTSDGGGILDAMGNRQTPSLVRVGPNIHPDLIEHSLEYKANMRIKAKGPTFNQEKMFIKNSILKESSIVCATQSMCGSRDMVAFEDEFDTVIIDEASQGVELSTLIPLRLGCRRLILVGDPRQLSATVVSRIAIDLKYDTSLFQRLEEAGYPINVLSIQYRMHPEISHFPSKIFYNSQLKDAENILAYMKPPIPWSTIPIFKPLVFFSINTSHTKSGTSLINPDEANLAVQLVELVGMILQETGQPSTIWTQRIAIISPYAHQVKLIRSLVKTMLRIPDDQPCPIDVNTVDGFQGREKEFIVFSAVRAHTQPESGPSNYKSVGFLADVRRMNVAMTRGRQNLWIIGNGQFLMGNKLWSDLWKHCAENNCLFNINLKSQNISNYFKGWLLSYFNRRPESQVMFQSYVPNVLKKIELDTRDPRNRSIFSDNELKKTMEHNQKDLIELQNLARKSVDDFLYTENDEGDFDPALKKGLDDLFKEDKNEVNNPKKTKPTTD